MVCLAHHTLLEGTVHTSSCTWISDFWGVMSCWSHPIYYCLGAGQGMSGGGQLGSDVPRMNSACNPFKLLLVYGQGCLSLVSTCFSIWGDQGTDGHLSGSLLPNHLPPPARSVSTKVAALFLEILYTRYYLENVPALPYLQVAQPCWGLLCSKILPKFFLWC